MFFNNEGRTLHGAGTARMEKSMATKAAKPFKKGDTVKVKRGAFKTTGKYVGTTGRAEGRGGGVWHKVDTANFGVRHYRETNLSR